MNRFYDICPKCNFFDVQHRYRICPGPRRELAPAIFKVEFIYTGLPTRGHEEGDLYSSFAGAYYVYSGFLEAYNYDDAQRVAKRGEFLIEPERNKMRSAAPRATDVKLWYPAHLRERPMRYYTGWRFR